jgi:phage antirepressor YoqD-like protein
MEGAHKLGPWRPLSPRAGREETGVLHVAPWQAPDGRPELYPRWPSIRPAEKKHLKRGEGKMDDMVSRSRTMDSLEIAERTGKRHADVIRDIENTLELAGIDQRSFASIYSDSYGRNQRCYRLPGHELMLLLTGYSVPLRDKVLRRWEELERSAAPELPDFTDPVKSARAWADQVEARGKLAAEVAVLAPKAAAADRICLAEGLRTVSQVGKINGLGPRKIFEDLIARGILYRSRVSWVPYQRYIDSGYFVVRESTYRTVDGKEHLSCQTYVTGKGEVWLADRIFGSDSLLLDFTPAAMA